MTVLSLEVNVKCMMYGVGRWVHPRKQIWIACVMLMAFDGDPHQSHTHVDVCSRFLQARLGIVKI